ncbi:hypothetical protein DFH09DRAFT_1089971 [Mycena vulgaris]|nr:hypothetical protein DFH09DRAFT_1089971 [Mycena vulgaris]
MKGKKTVYSSSLQYSIYTSQENNKQRPQRIHLPPAARRTRCGLCIWEVVPDSASQESRDDEFNLAAWSHVVPRVCSSASDGRKGSKQIPHQTDRYRIGTVSGNCIHQTGLPSIDFYAPTDTDRDRIGTGIAPTIIAVRVGLGYSVESVDSFVAPTPRTRVVSQFPGAPHVESVHEILYIRPISVKVETV